jgi:hypothetical protein
MKWEEVVRFIQRKCVGKDLGGGSFSNAFTILDEDRGLRKKIVGRIKKHFQNVFSDL